MALTRNEIRKRLAAFAKEQQGASNERSQAQTFWLRFYECFGIRAESATIYEQSVKKLGGAQGFIDSFIPGKLIVEHKSKGKDLDAAFDQASEYFLSLKEEERPRYIITSDFARIRLYDLQAGVIEMPAGIAAQIQGHAPQGVREQHYIRRPLDLLRMWHVKIEAWILEQAGIKFVPVQAGLRAVS